MIVIPAAQKPVIAVRPAVEDDDPR